MRIKDIYRELLELYEKDPEAQGNGMLNSLVDFEALVGMHFALPLLDELNRFIKMCQLRDIFVLDLLSDLQATRRRITRMYVDATAFTGASFTEANGMLQVCIAWKLACYCPCMCMTLRVCSRA